ncbi:ankyrin repeat domain-containing protein [Acidovorax sp. CCYZU-2555]|uniref:ankyrin repeat domain-containing protein n=1 Tax=Acidovorax sp. CCYZU-2555 TaxID=2835042 RepID=UPI001BCD74B8|nr:ankyrin repeat domain-containing protein [Acidovorax sp. CCYZU-2555]MBS7779904.1 ankyrin repeat domain-containing protein [Acidovorax sp. CCYZU-2555]
MNFGNSAEETALPRTHTSPPAPDKIQAAVESLISAISIGDLSSFKKIINDNDRIFSSYILNRYEIIHKAVSELQPEMVRILLDRECKPDIDRLNKFGGYTPLFLAISELKPKSSSVRYQIIDLLMEKGANTKILNPETFSLWTSAVLKNDLDLAELLLKHRADPNEVDCLRVTPIGNAALNSTSEMVDLLIKAKADVNSFPNENRFDDPLQAIRCLGRKGISMREKMKIVESVVAAGSKITTNHIHLCFGSYDFLNILAGGNIDTEDSLRNTAREKIPNEMGIKISDSTLVQILALETAISKINAEHLNLVNILRDSIQDSEEKKAFISNKLNTAVETGNYIELDLMQDLGGVFNAKRHTEKKATAVKIVTNAQKETSKKPWIEEILKKIDEKIDEKISLDRASLIQLEEILIKQFFSKYFAQYELNSEKYCETIYKKDKDNHKLETPEEKVFFTALMDDLESPIHIETTLGALVHFIAENGAIDEELPTTDKPDASETAQAPADLLEPAATDENVDAVLIGNTPEY